MTAPDPYLSIAEASAQLKTGKLRSVDLVVAALARIEATNATLHAVITTPAAAALEAARIADAEIEAGRWRGPLHGIPVGYKDIYETAGILSTGHSRRLESHVPVEDAATVSRIRQAGGITIAKLATHEFANGGPSFDLPWPPARNPWGLEHVPGGSSSGSGAAVAAGLCTAAMGSDTGGSIRGPAGLCGIVGLKPTYGLLSRRGIVPLSWTLDHAGPMTRDVLDCALMMQELGGYDPRDPASVETAIPDYASEAVKPVTGLRIGVARSWYAGPDGADDEVCAAVDSVAASLSKAGAEVRDVELPDLSLFHACGRLIILSEAYSLHRAALQTTPEIYGLFFRQRVRLGAFISAADYLDAMRLRRQLTDQMAAAMEKSAVDVILTANQYGAAEPFSRSQHPFPFFRKPYLTMPFNVTGMPALTVCAGFARSGLPVGVQLAGRPFEDAVVMQVGHAFETERGPLGRRPIP
jgi:aspartyl-tRNA(Asn)/glutamyl-tRNA(Gln) amidotransferase subunit A